MKQTQRYKPAKHNSFKPQPCEYLWAECYRKLWRQDGDQDTDTLLEEHRV